MSYEKYNVVFKIKSVTNDGEFDNRYAYDFEGYLSTYGNRDRVGDIFEQGAYRESIANKNVVPMLYNHDGLPIGQLALIEDAHGVLARGTFNKSDDAKIVKELVQSGALSDMSVGALLEEFEVNDDWTFTISKASIVEGSVVLAPANPEATIDTVKSILVERATKFDSMSKNVSHETIEKQEETQLTTEEIKVDEVVAEEVVTEEVAVEEAPVEIEKSEPVATPAEDAPVADVVEVEEVAKGVTLDKHFKRKGEETMNKDQLQRDFMKEVAKASESGRAFSLKSVYDNFAEKAVTNSTAIANILPYPVQTALQNAFERHTGLLNFITTVPTYNGLDISFNSTKWVAGGHTEGAEKTDVTPTITRFTIPVSEIYIKTQISYLALKRDVNGAYLNYALTELGNAIIEALEDAITIGDTSLTGFTAILDETNTVLFDNSVSADFTAASFTADQIDAITQASDAIASNAEQALITSKAIARKLINVKDANGVYLFGTPADVLRPIVSGEQFGGYRLIIKENLPEATPVILLAADGYTAVGDATGEAIERYDIYTNVDNFEFVGAAGGRLSTYKGAAIINQTEEA